MGSPRSSASSTNLHSTFQLSNMLAAKRSLGNLRAAASRSAGAAQAQPSSIVIANANNSNSNSNSNGLQARTLVSAVLLSRDLFEKKTVKQLQEELGERGLSTRGKKAVLVDRLLENVSRNPPPMPTLSSSSSSSSAAASRGTTSSSFSTTTAAYAKSRNDNRNADPATSSEYQREAEDIAEAPQVHTEAAQVFTPSPVQQGSEPPTMGEEVTKDGKPVITAAPGLVIDKAADEKLAETASDVPGGTIEMPESATLTSADAVFLPSTAANAPDSGSLAEAMIPSFPDEYRQPDNHDPFHQPFTMHPSWINSGVHTVDGEQGDVHHQGSHNMPKDDPHSRTSEPRKEFQYVTDATFMEEALATIGIKPSSVKKTAKKQSTSVLRTLQREFGFPSDEALKEAKKTADKAASAAAATPKGEVKYKFQDRQLDNDERSGLYVLVGILGGGLLLGGAAKKGKKEYAEKATDDDKKH